MKKNIEKEYNQLTRSFLQETFKSKEIYLVVACAPFSLECRNAALFEITIFAAVETRAILHSK